MTTRAIERVDDWETRSFGGGYRGLHGLADGEFSGVVRSPAGTLCMLNGAVVGILDGRIDDFEDADGTAYEAPTPALPLLIVMQDRAEEVRAKYYTEDTPLSKVDSTLSDGGFTGYIELSENVLSGDYYVVYHGGRSMSVAFVGNSGQLLSEDEAFERANDEVGIYKVRAVDIDPIEIPEPPTPAAEEDSDSTATAVGTTPESDGDATGAEPAEDQAEDRSVTADEPEGTTDSDPETADETDVPADAERDSPGESETEIEPTADAESASTSNDDETERRSERSSSGRSGGTGGQEATVTERDPDGAGAEETATAEATTGEETEVTEKTTDVEQRTTAETIEEPEKAPREQARTDPPSGESESGTTGSERSSSTDRRPEPSSTATAATKGGETGSAADLETRTIPSLDPDRTWSETRDAASSSGPATTGQSTPSQKPEPSDDPRPRSADSSGSPERSRESAPTDSPSGSEGTAGDPTTERAGPTETGNASRSGTDERIEELEDTIAEREERIDELETRLQDARQEHEAIATERDELVAERDALAAERDELQAERDELQAELEGAREELADLREQRDSLQSRLEGIDAGGAAEQRLSRQEAMDGTDLFVRYDSKGEPTLKTAHDSGASRSDVNANLNVEYHTQFETDGAVVAGHPFDTFLRNTIEFRFASWLVRQLLFEVRDTGHESALSDLYDALPLIDRAELNGEATVEYTEEGQTKRSQQSFDVVFRDRMGNPLIVANFNDSREAATEDDMRSLVTAATRVGESTDTLAGAIYVTASFFEPDALEMADDATGGGLLSRDKRESYVKVSRKQGYHLCLVEARDEQFHMAVPEL